MGSRTPQGRGHASGALGGGARDGCAPDSDDGLDRRERADEWVDGDHGFFRRSSLPR
jgi:hypothetical protein